MSATASLKAAAKFVAEAPRTLGLEAGALRFDLVASAEPFEFRYDGGPPLLIVSFDAGDGVAEVLGRTRGVSCAPGAFALFSGDMRVHVRHEAAMETLQISYGADALAGHADLTGYGEAIARDLPIESIDPGVRALASEARRALVQEACPDRAYMTALGEAILARALQVIDHGAPRRGRVAMSPFKLRRVVDLIEAGLDRKITVQALAEAAGLSTAHFARAFRQATGEAPHHFILTRRIARVRELLHDPELDLATVAARAGFSSHAHMSSAFQRHTSLAPGAYRAAVTAAG